MKEKEILDRTTKIKNIEENIWKEDSLSECENIIKEYKQIIKDIEKISDLKNDLTKYKVDEEHLESLVQELINSKESIETKKRLLEKLEMQQEVFNCPSCTVQLRFNDDELCIYEGEKCNNYDLDITELSSIEKSISVLEKTISSLETTIPIKQNKLLRYKEITKSIEKIKEQYDDIPIINDIKNDLEYIRNYMLSNKESDRQLQKLKSITDFSSTILSFEKDLEKQDTKIQIMKNNNECTEINEEELRQTITDQKQNKEKLRDLTKNLKTMNEQQTTFKKQIKDLSENHTQKYKQIKTESEINTEISKNQRDLSDLNEKQTEHKNTIDNIEKYQNYIKEKEVYNTWVKKINTLEKDEKEYRKLYASATLLREKILESESIAMINIISSINTHSQTYLDAFFPDNPISVRLVPFKESKSGSTKGTKKPQINLEIEYKGMEADINMLSGGELSRVILSYAMALGEMFNTPLMLLDECTSSLDEELIAVVMDGIKENFQNKLVIIIAHQPTKGAYDHVIEL